MGWDGTGLRGARLAEHRVETAPSIASKNLPTTARTLI